MKKNQIKFVGVCAAALLTVGALTPTASTIAHAEDGISTLALTQTVNNLKSNVNMTYSEFKSLQVKLNALTDTSDVSQWTIADPAWSSLWNHNPDVRPYVSYNVGLQNVDLTATGAITQADPKGISKVLIKSDYNKTTQYRVGDHVTLTFVAADKANDQVGSDLASVTVTIVDAIQDYEATGQNITAAIGDQYNLNQGVVVNNKETGKPLTYIDYGLVRANDFAGLQPNGDIIIDGTTYDQGTWYTIQDVTTKDGVLDKFDDPSKDRVKTEVDVNNKATIYKYDKVVNFDQTLKVFIYNSKNLNDANFYYINRTIKVVDDKAVSPVPVYRAYNSNDGDHLFTTSQSEYNNVISAGWAAENIAWNAASSNADGGKVVYRVYNANSGEHFYTASREEYINLGKAGWTQEGEAFYSPKAEGNVAVYRAFNPNAKGPGSHMFTTSKSEYDNIVKAGWTGEGVAFYGLYED